MHPILNIILRAPLRVSRIFFYFFKKSTQLSLSQQPHSHPYFPILFPLDFKYALPYYKRTASPKHSKIANMSQRYISNPILNEKMFHPNFPKFLQKRCNKTPKCVTKCLTIKCVGCVGFGVTAKEQYTRLTFLILCGLKGCHMGVCRVCRVKQRIGFSCQILANCNIIYFRENGVNPTHPTAEL